MKVTIVGAGGQGGPCASILAKDKDVTKIVLGDINTDSANKVKEKIGSDKIQVAKIDATSVDSIVSNAKDADVIFDMVIPQFSPNVVEAALKVNAQYVSTAFDKPWWNELIEERALSFDEEFKKANLTALLGCGMAPGFINVITRYYVDKLDEVKSIKLRVAKMKSGVDEMLNPWNPGWSPRQALIDCEEPAFVLEEGKIDETPAYSGLETYDFPAPFGQMKVTHHAHEEPLTIPLVIDKGLKYCDFKYYLSPQPAVFVTAGLESQEPVDVNGTSVVPLDLLLKLLPKSENAFLNEDPSKYEWLDENMHVCLMSEITGTIDGKEKTYKIHMPKLTANGAKLNELFGTSLVNVALPAVIGAKMAIAGTQKGVVFPEALDADDFLKRFLDTGIPYKWHEL